MNRNRVTIANLLLLILFLSMVFAGLRSASNDWFKLIYSLTFLVLVYAAIAARYRGPFWHGFAVAGWAYFIIGFGPWIGEPPGSEPLRAVNRNIATSVILEIVSDTMGVGDPPPRGPGIAAARMFSAMRRANRSGICHSALTIVFALGGGWLSKTVAGRALPPRLSEE